VSSAWSHAPLLLAATGGYNAHMPYRTDLFDPTSLAGIDRFGSPLAVRRSAFAPRKLEQ